MLNHKKLLLSFAVFAAVTTLVLARDTAPTNAPPVANSKSGPAGTNTVRKASPTQADVASKTATFGKASKSDELCKTALDAHALNAALKQVNKDGAFKGKVTKIFEPRGGGLAIVNFDANYRTALTALLKKEDFNKFPALTNLLDKDVVVTGKFVNYQGRAEIVLTNAMQIKLVE